MARAAGTLTDSFGRYVLCGARTGMQLEVGSQEGQAESRYYEDGVTSYDFELVLY